jgi:peptidyl-prolyl cis-trans isomerase C
MKIGGGFLVPRNKWWRGGNSASLVAVAGVALSLLIVGRPDALPAGVALRVDGINVTETDVGHRMDVLKALYGIQQPTDPKGKDTFRRDSAKAVAVSIILDNEARNRNIVIADKAANDTLTSMINAQLGGNRQSFIDLLSQYRASQQDVIDEIKRQQSVDRIFQQIGAGAAAQVSDADVRKYYDDHKSVMVTPEQRSIQNVVVTDQNQANTVLQAARTGSDFSALVAQYSVDDSTRSANGNLGYVVQSQLENAYASKAFAGPAGTLFGPVQTSHGWNVGKVLDVKPAVSLTFDQVKAQIGQQLRWDRASAAWRGWLGQLIRNAHARYADSYRPADPDAPPPVSATPPQISAGQPTTSGGTP